MNLIFRKQWVKIWGFKKADLWKNFIIFERTMSKFKHRGTIFCLKLEN